MILLTSLRVDRDADRILVCAVHHRRDVPRDARAARFILAARGTHLGGNRNIFSQLLSPVPGFEVRFAALRVLTWVRMPVKISKQTKC